MTTTAKIISMDDCRPTGAQLEDGYVRIANELYDAVLNSVHSLRHIKVVFALIRKTYGFNKKEDDITISQIAELACVHRNHVGRAIKDLEEMRVINPVRAGRYGLILGLNKRHDEWAKDEIKPRGQATKLVDSNQIGRSKQPNGCIEATKLVDLSNQNVAHKRQPQKTISKDNSKRLVRQSADDEMFAEFYAAYPRKAKPDTARRAFAKRKVSRELLDDMLAAIDRAKGSNDWTKEGGKYIPMPASWLNAGGWKDEGVTIEEKFTDRQQAFIDAFNDNIGDLCIPVESWSPKRAELADSAMRGAWDLEKWGVFWKRVASRCSFKGAVSFEALMNRDFFARVRDGEFGDMA